LVNEENKMGFGSGIMRIIMIPLGVFSVLMIILSLQTVVSTNWNTVATGITPVFVMITVIGMLLYGWGGSNRGEPVYVAGSILTFGCIGVVISAMFEHWNTNGILIDEFISGTIVITDLMIFTITPFIMLGVIIGVLKYG